MCQLMRPRDGRCWHPICISFIKQQKLAGSGAARWNESALIDKQAHFCNWTFDVNDAKTFRCEERKRTSDRVRKSHMGCWCLKEQPPPQSPGNYIQTDPIYYPNYVAMTNITAAGDVSSRRMKRFIHIATAQGRAGFHLEPSVGGLLWLPLF